MKAWLRDILDAVLLRSSAFDRVAARPDAFLRGLLVILAVALVAGLPVVIGDIIDGFGPAPVIEPSDLKTGLTDSLTAIRPWLQSSGVPEAMIEQIRGRMEDSALLAGNIASQIQRTDTFFPRPLAQGFLALGQWFSQPFANSPFPLATATLATWLGYGVWVMLVAKLLGGRGALHEFFGATAFFAAPHVLTIFARVPVLGGVLGVVAWLWGLVIYIVATAASHRLSLGRATVAVFLPALALLAVVALLLVPISLLALFSGGGR